MDDREAAARKKYNEMSIAELSILLHEEDHLRLGTGQRPFAQAVLDEKLAARDKADEEKEEARHAQSMRETKKSNRIAFLALLVSIFSILIAIYAMNNGA